MGKVSQLSWQGGINGTRVKGWLHADLLRPIAELDGSGNLVSRFVYATKANVPDYLIRNGVTYRVISDHLGSARVILDAATGVVLQRMDFHASGEILQDSNPGWQPFGFAGGLHDHQTGLIRFGARDFDPTIGRWLARDPIGLSGGDANLFVYAANDALNNVDPQGLEIFPKGVPVPKGPYGRGRWRDIQNHYYPPQRYSGEDDAADAFRHCLASCEVAVFAGEGVADLLGWLNEVVNSKNPDSRRMDDYNNACGRRYSRNVRPKSASCETQCFAGAQSGRLIITP